MNTYREVKNRNISSTFVH